MSNSKSATMKKISRLNEAIAKLYSVQGDLFTIDGLDHAGNDEWQGNVYDQYTSSLQSAKSGMSDLVKALKNDFPKLSQFTKVVGNPSTTFGVASSIGLVSGSLKPQKRK